MGEANGAVKSESGGKVEAFQETKIARAGVGVFQLNELLLGVHCEIFSSICAHTVNDFK